MAECRPGSAGQPRSPGGSSSYGTLAIGHGRLAICRASVAIRVSNGLFELDAEGEARAFIVPTRMGNPMSPEASDPVQAVREGEILDLLAFSPSYPMRWALRTGNATWLGAIPPQ